MNVVDPDRWRRVESICQAALDHAPELRAAFVAEACAEDALLRDEVEALLKRESAAGGFLSGGLQNAAASMFGVGESLVGRRIGQYDVTARLGAGGMGEVYRARDTTLGRDVAIKVVLPAFAVDPERTARFEREARVLASLNHPNVATIHGLERIDGSLALVLELIDGETLADRIARGAIPVHDALGIAVQIADALEAAHERAIVHRDLKPANIKITPAGMVKVLDFGLAKAVADGPGDSPTLAAGATREGAVVGTVAYLSPEQARGQAVDKRTDIWAFGCVLFEMLTGRAAFGGATMSDTMAEVLTRDPDWSIVPRDVTPSIERVLRRCLAKDLRQRLHDIADARIEINNGTESPNDDAEGSQPTSIWRLRPVTTAALSALLGAALSGLVAWSLFSTGNRNALMTSRSVVTMPADAVVTETIGPSLAVSPDGSMVAFAAVADGRSRLYVRRIDALEAAPLPGTEGGPALVSLTHAPEFSPDGQWIAFGADGLLKKIAVSGGAAQTLAEAPGLKSVTWTGDGQLVISTILQSGLALVPAAGGEPKQITTTTDREVSHRAATMLPGGKALLMSVGTDDMASWDDARIEAMVLSTGERKVLVQGGMQPRYLPTGDLLYARAGSLLTVPFDADRLEIHGTPRAVVNGINTDSVWGYANYAVSRTGLLVYAPGGANLRPSSLIWFDRKGQSERLTDFERNAGILRISPDGSRVAVAVDSGNNEIWTLDLRRAFLTRLVYGNNSGQPIWTTDGTRVTFSSGRPTAPGETGFWSQAVDATGGPRAVPGPAIQGYANAWSPDDRELVFTERGGINLSYWSASDRKPHPLPNGKSARSARLSRDGRLVAFSANDTGRDEIYVQQFPGPAARQQVSVQGGRLPIWSRDGRELFFIQGTKMMAVQVHSTGNVSTSAAVTLFDAKGLILDESSYDVAPDGRFLMIKNEPRTTTQLHLVQNWFVELGRPNPQSPIPNP